MPYFSKNAVTAVDFGKRVLRRVPAIRRAAYALKNAQQFGNLFWHDAMIADRVRVSTYARAIERHVQPGMRVLDLGTGTGVLAALAARRGAKVIAIEHTDLIEHAKEFAARNRIEGIEFVRTHSRDFAPRERLDVILHEQIGMNLVDEDMFTNVGDLRRRLLAPGGLVLPARFELLVAPVMLRDDRCIPYVWEQHVEGLDFSSFRPTREPWREGRGYDKRGVDPRDVASVLAPEAVLGRFDLAKEDAPSTRWSATMTANAGGRLDGFAVYFRILFDDTLTLRTGPLDPPTHWTPQLFRTEQRDIAPGQSLTLQIEATHPTKASTWTWSYSVR